MIERKRCATARRSASPARCPRLSLTTLKWSRSTNATARPGRTRAQRVAELRREEAAVRQAGQRIVRRFVDQTVADHDPVADVVDHGDRERLVVLGNVRHADVGPQRRAVLPLVAHLVLVGRDLAADERAEGLERALAVGFVAQLGHRLADEFAPLVAQHRGRRRRWFRAGSRRRRRRRCPSGRPRRRSGSGPRPGRGRPRTSGARTRCAGRSSVSLLRRHEQEPRSR